MFLSCGECCAFLGQKSTGVLHKGRKTWSECDAERSDSEKKITASQDQRSSMPLKEGEYFCHMDAVC